MTLQNAAKILIIDDDEIILMQVEHILEQNGYIPLCANSGDDGLLKACSESPQVIILDRKMPDIDGNEVLIELKANEDTASIPVIMLTGDQQVMDISTSFELGAADYIVKPFDTDNFLERVQKILK